MFHVKRRILDAHLMENRQQEERIQINVQLTGADAERFRAYKAREFLRNAAEAARKLILERLAELDQKAA